MEETRDMDGEPGSKPGVGSRGIHGSTPSLRFSDEDACSMYVDWWYVFSARI